MAKQSDGVKGQPQFLATAAPELGVDETLVADYAALVGNHKVLTTAERLALSGVNVWEGLIVEDTTDLNTYKRVGGAWRLVLGDTGEFQAVAGGTDITFGSGWSHYLGSGWSGVRLRVKNGRVTINGAAAKTTFPALESMLSLVSKYWPPSQVQGIQCQVSTAGLITTGVAGSGALSFNATWDLA